MASGGLTVSSSRLWESRPRRYLPNSEQQLLLRAALLPDERARAAWEALGPGFDPDRLDSDSKGLLGLLFRNLRKLGVEDPRLGRFKGIYRLTWFKNQLLFHAADGLLAALERADIPTILLKGAALVTTAYRDVGLRAMADFDILIPT